MASIERLRVRAMDLLAECTSKMAEILDNDSVEARDQIQRAQTALETVDVPLYLAARRNRTDYKDLFTNPIKEAEDRLGQGILNVEYYLARLSNNAAKQRRKDWLDRVHKVRQLVAKAKRCVELMKDDIQRRLLSGCVVVAALAVAVVWALANLYLQARPEAANSAPSLQQVAAHAQLQSANLLDSLNASTGVADALTKLVVGVKNLVSSFPPLIAAAAALVAAIQATLRRN